MDTTRIPVTGGVELHLNLWPGTDPRAAPFLLVHGLASNARMWDGVAAYLAAQGHAVAAVDQRGHGLSDKPDTGYDFATVAADLAAVIDALGFDRPVVAGQSWGGNVVLELAARHGEQVRGIACVDGGWIDLSRFANWEECERAMAPPRTAGMPLAQLVSGMRGRHPDWPETGIQGALACFEVRSDDTVAPWLTYERHLLILRALWEHRPKEVYPLVESPVLLLPCGDGTAWTERKRAEVAVAEGALAKVRTHWFDAHHDVHAQYPDKVAAVLTGCLEDGFFA